MSTGPPARSQGRLARCPAGRRSLPPEPFVVAANTVATTRPPASTAGPPELPDRIVPAQRRSCAAHRPVAVRVAADHGAGLAEPAGDRPVGTVLRIPEDRDRLADRRAACAGRARGAPSPGTRSTATSLWGSKTIAWSRPARRRRRASTVVSSSPATTCAFVTTTPGARDPTGALHGEAAGVPSTRTTLVVRRLHVGVAQDAPRRGRARRPPVRGCGGTGRRARARSGSGPTAAAPRSASRGSPSAGCPCGSSRAPGVCSATAPAIHTSPRPSVATSTAPPMPSSDVRGAERHPPPDALPHRLEDDRREAADHQRASRG